MPRANNRPSPAVDVEKDTLGIINDGLIYFGEKMNTSVRNSPREGKELENGQNRIHGLNGSGYSGSQEKSTLNTPRLADVNSKPIPGVRISRGSILSSNRGQPSPNKLMAIPSWSLTNPSHQSPPSARVNFSIQSSSNIHHTPHEMSVQQSSRISKFDKMKGAVHNALKTLYEEKLGQRSLTVKPPEEDSVDRNNPFFSIAPPILKTEEETKA